jgi:hypothetical protein
MSAYIFGYVLEACIESWHFLTFKKKTNFGELFTRKSLNLQEKYCSILAASPLVCQIIN